MNNCNAIVESSNSLVNIAVQFFSGSYTSAMLSAILTLYGPIFFRDFFKVASGARYAGPQL